MFLFQDFVPSKEAGMSSRDHYEMPDKMPENGGLSPRFSNRIRNPVQNTPSPDNFERQFLRVLHKVYQTIEKNEMRLAEQDRRDYIRLEWQQVALVVDRILLFLFVSLTTAVTLGVMLHAPHSRQFLFGGDDEEFITGTKMVEAGADAT